MLSDEIIETKHFINIYINLKMFADHLYKKLTITLRKVTITYVKFPNQITIFMLRIHIIYVIFHFQ